MLPLLFQHVLTMRLIPVQRGGEGQPHWNFPIRHLFIRPFPHPWVGLRPRSRLILIAPSLQDPWRWLLATEPSPLE